MVRWILAGLFVMPLMIGLAFGIAHGSKPAEQNQSLLAFNSTAVGSSYVSLPEMIVLGPEGFMSASAAFSPPNSSPSSPVSANQAALTAVQSATAPGGNVQTGEAAKLAYNDPDAAQQTSTEIQQAFGELSRQFMQNLWNPPQQDSGIYATDAYSPELTKLLTVSSALMIIIGFALRRSARRSMPATARARASRAGLSPEIAIR